MTGNSPLADLRDIHLPEPVSWWPPAPGWWLLLGLLFVLVLCVFIFLRLRNRSRIKRAALAEFAAIRLLNQQDADGLQTVKELSALLRRVCISYGPREQTAALVGDRWLQYLDRLGNCSDFNDGPGRLLIEAPYRPATDIDPTPLLDLCQHWLQKLPGKAKG